jgi:EAL domain-containing protein (putative c-di-GMP-specific phosphodiesterase class I)
MQRRPHDPDRGDDTDAIETDDAIGIEIDDAGLDDALERALAGHGIRTALQPIVSLAGGAALGYEALMRIDGLPAAATAAVFARAGETGCAAQLDTSALDAALRVRSALPSGRFLSVNLQAGSAGAAPVMDRLAREHHLDNVVLEWQGQDADIDRLGEAVERVERGNARSALDLSGVTLDGIARLLSLRPAFVKVDRRVVAGVDHDEARMTMLAAFLTISERAGSQLIAEGIERPEELSMVRNLGVPMGQGYLLGRPVGAAVVRSLRTSARTPVQRMARGRTIGALVEPAFMVPVGAVEDGTCELPVAAAILIGEGREPLALVDNRWGDAYHVPLAVVEETAGLRTAARVALSRPGSAPFEPLVVITGAGAALGIVDMRRVFAALARGDGGPARDDDLGAARAKRRRRSRPHIRR